MVSFNLTDWFKETFKGAAKMFIMLEFTNKVFYSSHFL